MDKAEMDAETREMVADLGGTPEEATKVIEILDTVDLGYEGTGEYGLYELALAVVRGEAIVIVDEYDNPVTVQKPEGYTSEKRYILVETETSYEVVEAPEK